MGSSQDRTKYWDDYYAQTKRIPPSIPSQFAVFVANEVEGQSFIVDMGCGTGRDAFFFAEQGHRVLGIDGSASAVHGCQSRRRPEMEETLSFLQSSVTDESLPDRIKERRVGTRPIPTVFYARFFLHAITEPEQESLIQLASTVCAGGGMLALEFRTARDAGLSKVTDDHYRRFPETFDVMGQAIQAGFSVSYSAEGFGFAKFKADDAYVARCLFRAS